MFLFSWNFILVFHRQQFSADFVPLCVCLSLHLLPMHFRCIIRLIRITVKLYFSHNLQNKNKKIREIKTKEEKTHTLSVEKKKNYWKWIHEMVFVTVSARYRALLAVKIEFNDNNWKLYICQPASEYGKKKYKGKTMPFLEFWQLTPYQPRMQRLTSESVPF